MTNPMQAPAATITHLPSASTNGRQADVRQSQDLAAELDGLRHRLATQPVIEQSKGILMAHLGIDSDSAFEMLKRWSSHTNLKVRDIGQMLVTTATANPPGDHRRASQDLIDLIHCLNKGQIPGIERVILINRSRLRRKLSAGYRIDRYVRPTHAGSPGNG